MKCLCDQGLDNKVNKLCEHHQRRLDSDMKILCDGMLEEISLLKREISRLSRPVERAEFSPRRKKG